MLMMKMALDDGFSFARFKYRIEGFVAEMAVLKEKGNSWRLQAEELTEKLRLAESKEDRLKASLQEQIDNDSVARRKLEDTVKMMRAESACMEEKMKSLKLEMRSVLEARNNVAEELKITNYGLKCKLKSCFSQLTITIEKLHKHAMLFEAAQAASSSIKRTLEETRQLVSSRTEAVLALQQKLSSIEEADQKLLERARFLESEVSLKDDELRSRNSEIVALKMALETASKQEPELKLATIEKSIQGKEAFCDQLKKEKQELVKENKYLRDALTKFEEAAAHQDELVMDLHNKLLVYEGETKKANENLRLLKEKEPVLLQYKIEAERLQREKDLWLRQKAQYEMDLRDTHLLLDTKASKTNAETSCLDLTLWCDEATSTEDLEREEILETSQRLEHPFTLREDSNTGAAACSEAKHTETSVGQKMSDDAGSEAEEPCGAVLLDDGTNVLSHVSGVCEAQQPHDKPNATSRERKSAEPIEAQPHLVEDIQAGSRHEHIDLKTSQDTLQTVPDTAPLNSKHAETNSVEAARLENSPSSESAASSAAAVHGYRNSVDVSLPGAGEKAPHSGKVDHTRCGFYGVMPGLLTDRTSCLCGQPPYGFMVKCSQCSQQFHAACISWMAASPAAYVCAACQQLQPAKKRRRSNTTKNL